MVSLTLIVKDELENMQRLIPEVNPYFDEIVVVDTGSTDGTLEYLKYLQSPMEGNQAYNVKFFEFDAMEDVYGDGSPVFNFGKARQYAADMATGDWVMWMDADDRAEGLENLPELMKSGKKMWFAKYYTYKNEAGEYILHTQRERLWKKGALRWQHFIHETATPNEDLQYPGDWNFTDLISVYHLAGSEDIKRSGERNLERIKKYCEVHGDNTEPRFINLLADSYYALSRWEEAIGAYKRYLAAERAPIPNAIYECVLHIADCYYNMAQLDEAKNEFVKAMVMLPKRPEAYCGLGSMYLDQENWEIAVHWFSIGVQMDPPKYTFITNEAVYTYQAWGKLGFALAKAGLYKEAYEAYRQASSYGEPIPSLLDDMKIVEIKLRQEYAIQAYLEIYKTVKALEPNKVERLLKSVPKPLNEDPRIKELIEEEK